MKRYTYNKNKNDYDLTLYPRIELDDGEYISIVTKLKDNLFNVAKKYYGDGTLWWIISIANDLTGDSLFVTPGTTLLIPKNVNNILKKFEGENK